MLKQSARGSLARARTTMAIPLALCVPLRLLRAVPDGLPTRHRCRRFGELLFQALGYAVARVQRRPPKLPREVSGELRPMRLTSQKVRSGRRNSRGRRGQIRLAEKCHRRCVESLTPTSASGVQSVSLSKAGIVLWKIGNPSSRRRRFAPFDRADRRLYVSDRTSAVKCDCR